MGWGLWHGWNQVESGLLGLSLQVVKGRLRNILEWVIVRFLLILVWRIRLKESLWRILLLLQVSKRIIRYFLLELLACMLYKYTKNRRLLYKRNNRSKQPNFISNTIANYSKVSIYPSVYFSKTAKKLPTPS